MFSFENYVLDPDRRELRRAGELVPVEPQVFDLILHLVRNRDRVATKDEVLDAVWNGRIVSESTLTSRVTAARRALKDTGAEQRLIRTVTRKGLRFVGEVREDLSEPLNRRSQDGVASSRLEATEAPAQEVTFRRTKDGVSLAVATTGAGLPVIKIGTWLTHVESDWQSPVWSPLLTVLAARFRLIRYDPRGCGLSGRQVADLSFEALVGDLEAVVDALDLQRFALLGISRGAAIAIAYAARYPDRVSRLVLHGGYPLGRRKRGDATETTTQDALLTLVRHGWEQANPAFQQVLTSRFLPSATGAEAQWLNDMHRMSTASQEAIRVRFASGDIDVTGLLQRVAAPTLVLHSRGDVGVPFEMGLMLAQGIPNARFVALDSRNHLILSHEPAWPRFIQETCDFLAGDREPGRSAVPRAVS